MRPDAWGGATADEGEELRAIREGVRAVMGRFGDEYWLACDQEARYPAEFHRAMADGGWLGITMPRDYGGAGLGVTEAAVMMNEVTRHGGGLTAASSIHVNLFGPHPIVVRGTDEQRRRWLPPLIAGMDQCAFAFTEADAGLETPRIRTFARKVDGGYRISGPKMWTSTAQVANRIMILARTTAYEDCAQPTEGMTLFYTALDRDRIEARPIPKMARAAVETNALFIDDLFVSEDERVGAEGEGFAAVFDSLNPERILFGAETVGIGQDALARAVTYAGERRVFGRPIGQNQAIQHPLAERWIALEAAWLMVRRAAALYDAGRACAAEANSAKFLGARAGHESAWAAISTMGGMGVARECHVERLYREATITRIVPVTEQMILNFVAEKTLGLPRSY